MSETKWPHSMEHLCGQISTSRRKSPSPTDEQKTQRKKEFHLSQGEIKLHTNCTLSYSYKKITFRFLNPRLQNWAQKRNKLYCSTWYHSAVNKLFTALTLLHFPQPIQLVCPHQNGIYTKFNEVLTNQDIGLALCSCACVLCEECERIISYSFTWQGIT